MAAAAQSKEKKAYDPYNLCIMEIENASMLGTAIQQWIVKEYKQKWGRHQNFLCGKGYVRTQPDALRMGSLVNALDARCKPTSVYLLATIDTLKKRFDELTRADIPQGVNVAIAASPTTGRVQSVLDIAGGQGFKAAIEEAVAQARSDGNAPPMSVDPPATDSTPLSAQFQRGAATSMPATPSQPPPFQRSPPSLIQTPDVPHRPTPPAQPAGAPSPPIVHPSAEDKGKSKQDDGAGASAAPPEQEAAGLVTWDDAITNPHDEYHNKLPRTHTLESRQHQILSHADVKAKHVAEHNLFREVHDLNRLHTQSFHSPYQKAFKKHSKSFHPVYSSMRRIGMIT